MKSSLADALANVFENKPASTEEAATKWAQAYVAYAQGALSSAGSIPVTAMAGTPILIGAFTTALEALQAQASALAMTGGVMAYWQTIAWVGPAAAGVTTVPGNFTLTGALAAIFADNSGSARDKADRIADAFDAGARMVMVMDQPFAPSPPIVGPIN